MNNIVLLNNRDEATIARLIDIWESAVRNTHLFLSERDIAEIKPEALLSLKTVSILYGYRDGIGALQGFIGVNEKKIETLFVDAKARGQGIGKLLLNYAVNVLGAKFVDVNEQNNQAVSFYERFGFRVISRSEYDDQGRPFPLSRLKI
ncbi:MAG: GNAT family N-acetyltransferase [Deltaproteobacteria bacterium]|jgi:putative acetyltransferase|nr:GNAT family N-acetyltransferase [Deltaproteobacteria bacterium]